MNLLFLVDLQRRSVGGGVYSLFKFAEALAGLGHQVDFFWIDEPRLFRVNEALNLSLHTRAVIRGSFRGSLFLDRCLDGAYDRSILRRFLKKKGENLDFIIGHQTRTAIKAVTIGEMLGVKIANFVFETPGWLRDRLVSGWEDKWKNARLRKDWDEFHDALLRSDLIFPNSWSTKSHVEEWLSVPVGDPVFPAIDRPARKDLPPGEKEQIIYVGRLRDHKNVPELIEALSRVEGAPLLVICGVGPEEKMLRIQAARLNVRCDFRGLVSEAEKWSLIAESRFMVFPSSFEGFGMPPMEALVQGIPCLAADIPILREVYGEHLEYFREHDIDKLTDRIRDLLNRPEYCRRRGEEGRAFVEARFSWESSARKIEGLLWRSLRRNPCDTGK
jgi:glycosyltransferase involved in cell wall biosynthesis